MCGRPRRACPGVRRGRAGRTQPWVTRALTTWAIQVGRRDRADTTSFSSDAGSLAHSLRCAPHFKPRLGPDVPYTAAKAALDGQDIDAAAGAQQGAALH